MVTHFSFSSACKFFYPVKTSSLAGKIGSLNTLYNGLPILFLITFWHKFWLTLKFVTNSEVASIIIVDAFVCTTGGNITFLKKLPFSRVTIASFTAFLCV